MSNTPLLFNRALLAKRQARSSAHFADVAFFINHASALLRDRLDDITRHFAQATLIGGYHGTASPHFEGAKALGTLNVIELDETENLPLAPASQDAILSVWGLHWVNDLPGMFTQIRRALKPDGAFIALLPGPQTLQELRSSFAHAASQTNHPLHNHIAPFVEVRDAGNLLQRAGFTLPVVSNEQLTITYEHPMKLLHELRAMGETNMLSEQTRNILPRDYMLQTLAHYHERHAMEDGRIPATVEFIHLTGWAPDASQPKPAKRGSGEMNFGEALNLSPRHST